MSARQIRQKYAGMFAALVLTAAHSGAAPVPGKPHAPLPPVKVKLRVSDPEWQERVPRTPESLAGFAPRAFPEPTWDKWGGRSDRKVRATGFFRVQKQGDRWWLVDPDGALFIHVGVAAVSPGSTPASQAALKTALGTPDLWATQATKQLRDLRFNGAGAWSDIPPLRTPEKERLVYTVIGNSGAPGVGPRNGGGFAHAFGNKLRVTHPGVGHTTFPNGCIPIFHPDFAAFCDEFARPLTGLKDDKYLLGYFSDNELPGPRLERYLALPPDDPIMGSSYKAAQNWLDTRKGKHAGLADITEADKDAWNEYVYDCYFAVTTAAIRKYDPHHLCLGSRFYELEERHKPGPFRAAGKYLDVIGVNYYFVWSPEPAELAQWTRWAGKPIMITEWYAKGMDSGFPNTAGVGWTVPTQEDRGLFYQTFTLGLLESKACVGWHWFKYMDNDPTDKNAEASNKDSNKGIVTNRYTVYPELVERMRSLNRHVYGLADYFDRKPMAATKR